MKKILITGATGNIGFEVIKFLYSIGTNNQIICGVRNIEKAKKIFEAFPLLDFVNFDIENADTFNNSFEKIDTVFLLRPPHISDVKKYFVPQIAKIKEKGIKRIIFLSVQGAEKSKVIPHNKIEKLIAESGIDYIFLRPSYFMQNLTTTLLGDIKRNMKIVLPAGSAKFNWIDVENIGETAAILLEKFDEYRNQIIELTGSENKNFQEVADLINKSTAGRIKYENVNPLRFYMIKKKEGMEIGRIIVMIALHFLPRFQKEPAISHFYEKLTGKKPGTLKEFIERESGKLVLMAGR